MEKKLRKKLKGGRFINVPVTRSKTMASIRGKNNRTTELRFRMALVRAGVKSFQIKKLLFLLMVVSGMVAQSVVITQRHENLFGKQKYSETKKETKKTDRSFAGKV